MKYEVSSVSLKYDFLKKLAPHSNKFYSEFVDGSYYDKAYTKYYDENKKEIHHEQHDYYG